MDYTGRVVRDSINDSLGSQYSRYLVPLITHRKTKGEVFSLDVDAAEMGNESRFINDYRGTGSPANVVFERYFEPGGEMRVGVRTQLPVRKGHELLADYGEDYWRQVAAKKCAGTKLKRRATK
uniref:SET domain-containing protein n=2 Tax=Lotharella globosa TaxID=91324 RepID=A0A7S3YCX3_9EUKA